MELVPFRAAIAEGVDAMMSAHIYFPALEPERLPVTLSHAVLTGLLRKELGYEGMIVTDCMEMKAIATHYGTVDAAVMAVEAGADVVLISHTAQLQVEAFEALMNAVKSGRISERRIDESIRRLLTYKMKRGLMNVEMELERDKAMETSARRRVTSGVDDLQATSGIVHDPMNSMNIMNGNQLFAVPFQRNRPQHQEVAQRISEKSITLIRDTQHMLPLKQGRTLVITVAAEVTSIADERLEGGATLGAALSAQGLEVTDIRVAADEVAPSSARLLPGCRSGGCPADRDWHL